MVPLTACLLKSVQNHTFLTRNIDIFGSGCTPGHLSARAGREEDGERGLRITRGSLDSLLTLLQILHGPFLKRLDDVCRQLLFLYEPQEIICQVLCTHSSRGCLRQILLVHAAIAGVECTVAICGSSHLIPLHVLRVVQESFSTDMRIAVQPGCEKLSFHMDLPCKLWSALAFFHLDFIA